MSADPTLMPDDPTMVQDIPEEGDRQTREPREEEIPLNAEESTVLVLSFLRRMGKRIITPKKAVLTNGVFVVDVELKGAAAVVHIDRKTREIVEFTIQPEVKEPKPLPIPPARILIMLGAVTVVVVLTMILTFFKMINVAYILSMVNSDHIIIGVGVLGIAGVAFLLYRRFRG
jgi:hypothetical protein